MKVRLNGFSLKPANKKMALADLFDHLEKNSGHPDGSGSQERRIYFKNDADSTYVKGLVVTVKDQKAFCKLVELGGKITINVENLFGKEKLMEFNFFVINKTNGLGLYQHYFQSCSLGVFGRYLRKYYRNISESHFKQEIKKAGIDETEDSKKLGKMKKQFAGQLEVATLVQSGSLATVLKEFARIKSFEYEFAELVSVRDVAAPLTPYVHRRKEKVVFRPAVGVAVIANAIQRSLEIINPKGGRVYVENEEGDSLSVKLADIPENFGEYEYEDVAGQLDNLDLLKFAEHGLIQNLLNTCNSNAYKHIFNAKFKK